MIKLAINGARGRMGQRLVALARDDARFDLVAEIARDQRADNALLARGAIDVIVDFSSNSGTKGAMELAQKTGAALLIGTTALHDDTRVDLDDLATRCAIMEAPNTSLGIAVLNALLEIAGKILSEKNWAMTLIDVHHDQKRDAPSGTARRLLDTLHKAGRTDLAPEDVLSIRAGDIIGEHTIEFFGRGERLQLRHAATDRDVFVHGALDAAAWLHGQSPGRYRIEDALGLPISG